MDGENHQAIMSASSVDKSDLTRMYDYATWNMYERIVSARRQRLTQLDSAQDSSREDGGETASTSATSSVSNSATSSTVGGQEQASVCAAAAATSAFKKPAIRTVPHSNSSFTDSTIDETDRSSSASSSSHSVSTNGTPAARRAESPAFIPGLALAMSPPDDDHFIFQLDM